ncbi:Uma2 family endonuclease [Tellurirhabdus rosea]|uniref:Uma2 family endonuclease n=1 Tax=Tellurirhabdus rosea TaxID=2674997 RepID=UPI0022508A44|nr:Uma2 family endonuclease [Tellurirhabdus rosea]
MSAPPKTYYTPEQYLEQERQSEYKSEYFRGEIFMMAGATPNHNRVKENLSGLTFLHLRGKSCRGFSSGQRLLVRENGLYTYPDYMVICGQNRYSDIRSDTVTNPVLIAEILSPSTESYDRGEKFKLYRALETLHEYVLLDSQKVRAEVFRKNENGFWYIASEADSPDGQIRLECIGLTLNMSDLYADTENLLPA